MANLILWNSYRTVLPGDPNRAVRPLGPHVLAAWLIKHGYTVKVIDFCNLMTADDLVDITMNHVTGDTIAIGVSNTFWGRKLSATFFEPQWLIDARIKLEAKYPSVQWVMGGYNNEREYKIERFKWHHMTNRFAEDPLLKFLDENSGKNQKRTEFDIVSSQSQYMDGLGITPHEVLPLELARGCQFKCMFCVYDVGKKKNSYIKKMANLKEELISNYEKYGTTRYIIVEETVNESSQKIDQLANIVTSLPFDFEWVGFNRLDLIGHRTGALEAIEASGMKASFFGIESFNETTSRKVGKAWNGTHAKDYLLYLRERWDKKISWTLSLIVGLMDDTEQDVDETQKWLIDNNMLNWAWWPLYIKNKKLHFTNRHTSLLNELDLNHENYGYTFIDDHNWVNRHWTLETATKKASALRQEANPYLTTNVWSATEIASAGFPLVETLYKKSNSDFDYNLINKAISDLVRTYVDYQKSISF